MCYSVYSPAVGVRPRFHLDNDGTAGVSIMDDKFCECGCGGVVRVGRRFLRGHYAKTKVARENTIERQTGRKASIETRAKMGAARIGRKPSAKSIAALIARNKTGWQKKIGYKISAALKGRKATDEARAKRVIAQTGRKHTPESIEKMRQSQLKRYESQEERNKSSIALKGRKFTAEALVHMSAAQKKRALEKPETFANVRAAARLNPGPSPETVKKMADANRGRKHTLEARANMSAGQRARAARMQPHEWGGWKGGTSKTPYPAGWDVIKSDIRKRDGGFCMQCGTNDFSRTLLRVADVHHINVNKSDCDSRNLVSLCRSCHKYSDIHLDESIPRLHAILSDRYGYTYD